MLVLFLTLEACSPAGAAEMVSSEAPRLSPRTVTLTEQWRAGGLDGDILFGMVVATETNAEGNLYALDSQLSCVEVFSPAGEHLRTISGEGDGPGEVRAPQDMALLQDGSLGLLKFLPAGIVRLWPDGTPDTSIELHPRSMADAGDEGGFAVSFGMESRGGTLVLAAYQSLTEGTGQKRRIFLSSFSGEGRELACLKESGMQLDFNAVRFVETEFFPPFLLTHAVGPGGKVYVPADWDSYAIEVYRPDGRLERVIRRPFQPRPRTDREKRRMDALVDAWGRQIPYEIPRELEPNAPTIDELFVDDEGILWVKHSRSVENQPDGVFATYDTFDGEGRWLQEVSVKADADPHHDGIRFLGDGRALVIKGYQLARWASRNARDASFGEDDDPGSMEIIACRVEVPGS
jgi:hypothetical protein